MWAKANAMCLKISRSVRFSRERSVPVHPEVSASDPDPLRLGRELHRRVPPERWCVTKEDIQFFEEEVRRAHRNGEIPNNPEHPNPHHSNPEIGPTMYEVCEHVIKPMTARYGGMSFALMFHPEGLTCDAFATHAWAEGVFEFLCKLKRGWPVGCEHMYVCFLANPQNLDISELLNVPIEKSPFAKALNSAKCVIVIPNRFVSIYTRLWCCYEAYLAYTLGKTLTLPPPKYSVDWVKRRAKHLVLAYIAGVLGAIAAHHSSAFREVRGHAIISASCWFLYIPYQALASRYCQSCGPEIFQILCRQGFSFSMSGFVCYGAFYRLAEVDHIFEVYAYLLLDLVCGALLAILPVGLVLEARAVEAAEEEAIQLAFPEHKLASAGCSNDQDRARILTALSGKEEEVEYALRVLLHQGVSTPEMRQASLLWSEGREGYVDHGGGVRVFASFVVCVALPVCDMLRSQLLVIRGHWIGVLSGFVIAFVCAYIRHTRELASMVVTTSLSPSFAMVSMSIFWFAWTDVMWIGGPPAKIRDVEAHKTFFDKMDQIGYGLILCNGVAGMVALIYLRHRHIREHCLLNYCNHSIAAASVVGFALTAVIGRHSIIVLVISSTCLIALLVMRLPHMLPNSGESSMLPLVPNRISARIAAGIFLVHPIVSIVDYWWDMYDAERKLMETIPHVIDPKFTAWLHDWMVRPLQICQVLFLCGLVGFVAFTEGGHYLRHKSGQSRTQLQFGSSESELASQSWALSRAIAGGTVTGSELEMQILGTSFDIQQGAPPASVDDPITTPES